MRDVEERRDEMVQLLYQAINPRQLIGIDPMVLGREKCPLSAVGVMEWYMEGALEFF